MKRQTMRVSVVLAAALACMVILGTQFLCGSNPPAAIMFLCLAVIGASIQILLILSSKHMILRLLPLLISFFVAAWGVYCYLFSEAWSHATLGDLLCEYCALFIGALLVWSIIGLHKKR